MRVVILAAAIASLAACSGGGKSDPRGIDRDETLLSVSASGRSETRPDMATLSVGLETFGKTGPDASKANEEKMATLVAALEKSGVLETDIQTQNVGISRIDWGAKKGKYQATNQVRVRVRKVDDASKAIGAATAAGANLLDGPNLTQSDPEKGKLSAYGNAYKAARARADAYAEAAGMRVSRILAIRDGGQSGQQPPYPYETAAEAAGDAASAQVGPPIRIGTDINEVTVSVDFALEEK